MLPRPLTDVHAVVLSHFCCPNLRKPKALVVVLDGVRPDCLDQEQLSVFLGEVGGTISPTYTGGIRGTPSQQATDSAAGWAALLTGLWGRESGIVDNASPSKYPEVPSFLQTLTWRGFSVASVVSWQHIHRVILRDEELAHKFAPDRDCDDSGVLTEALAVLQGGHDAFFLGFNGPDEEGHRTGFSPGNPAYRQSIGKALDQTRQICSAVRSRPSLDQEDWLLVVTTDHGGLDKGHGGQSNEERTVFLIEGKCRHLDFPRSCRQT